MRVFAFCACLITAFNAAEKALGIQKQYLFAAGNEWIWFFLTFGFIIGGAIILIRGTDF